LADTGADLLQHEGQEGGVVVKGKLELTVAQQTWILHPGDGYYFESRLPHRFRNPSGNEICEIVSSNSPPTF
jgi:quercetin dioxygenase-like cupin family protein